VEALEDRCLLTTGAVPDLIVQLAPGGMASLPQLQARAAAEGLALVPTINADQFRAQGSAAALDALSASLAGAPYVQFAQPEQTVTVATVPNDPKFQDGTQYDMNGTFGISAPAAWGITTGSTKVVVADVDTGIDYNHPDLYLNVWVNQSAIPAQWLTKSSPTSGYDTLVTKSQVKDVDGDGLITFYDLNAPANAGLVWDNNGDGRIDAGDLLRPVNQGGWDSSVDGQGHDTNLNDAFFGWNYIGGNNDPFDDNGHGTHTAGTIGAIGNNGVGLAGVNWQVQIMAVKMLDASGSGTDTQSAAAIRFAAAHGAVVANASWGGGFSADNYSAIHDAGAVGMIFVAAAGNSAANNDVNPLYPAGDTITWVVSGQTYPGLPNIISVAATDATGKLASFSNFGATSVSLGAPGVSIYSTVPISQGSYGFKSGTSMATPHVTGTVGLLLAANPSLTASQAISRILNFTTPDSNLAGMTVTGGLLNAAHVVAPPPVLQGVPDQTVSKGQQLMVTLSATDPLGLPLTYGGSADTLAYTLKVRYSLHTDGKYYLNYGGKQDKWIMGAGTTWFFILPDGSLYQWDGTAGQATGTLIANVGTAAYADPTVLTNAQPGNGPASVSVSSNVLTITPNTGFIGSFGITATASDGLASDTKNFIVTVTTNNHPPVLDQPSDASIAKGATYTVTLHATDQDGDPITYGGSAVSQAYQLKQQYGFFFGGNDYFNYGGQQDKWFQGSGSAWFFILPSGKLYKWDGTAASATGTLITTMDVSYYADPSLLYNATTGASVSVNGTQLTVTPNTGFVGYFTVTATASDGLAMDSKMFTLTVNPPSGSNQPPVLDQPSDASIAKGTSYTVTLHATDADGDSITYSGSVASQAYQLKQQYGFFFSGNDYFNYGGKQDKWFQGSGGAWFFILPNGQLYKWDGTAGQATGTLIATMDASYYKDPSLLYNATRGATVSVNGNQLTVTPDATFVGLLTVTATASDGQATDSKSFTLTVS
jgi:subtilisin family serine protease